MPQKSQVAIMKLVVCNKNIILKHNSTPNLSDKY